MALEKYDNYKDSGIEWIGEIPEHWEVTRFAFHFSLSRGLSITKQDLRDKGIPCVNYGEIHSKFGFEVNPEKNSLRCVDQDYLSTSNKSLLSRGDFVFADTSEDVEGAGNFTCLNSDILTFAGYHTIIARQKTKDNYKFLAYYFDSLGYRNQIRSNVSGIKVLSITQAILKKSQILLPPLPEQTAIANYLDHKTAQIDELISKKQRLIALLQEERTAIINQAVTKGIDPNVPMKDSGIEWLGEIPAHWEVKRIKYLGKIINGYAFKSDSFILEGNRCRVMKISNIQTMKLDWSDESFVANELYNQLPSFQIKKGDLVFALTRPIISTGIKAAIVDTDEQILLNQRNAVLKPDEGLSLMWMYYLIFNSKFVAHFESLIDNTGQQPNISSSDISNISIPFPDKKEQDKIIDFVSNEFNRIDDLKSKVGKEIDLLKEYKTALISEVVTGKVKITE